MKLDANLTESCSSASRIATEMRQISSEEARKLGVRAGAVSPSTELPSLLNLASVWCAPLVIAGPSEVFDFTKGYDAGRKLTAPFGIGRYDEDRVGMYETAIFKGQALEDRRTIHMGLDIGASEGTPVFSPFAGEIFGTAKRTEAGDYGGTIIVRGEVSGGGSHGEVLFSLFGHLSFASADRWKSGERVECGELLGWLGSKSENGGWNPHLHWQISRLEPLEVDLPGAVSAKNRDLAREIFPDPTDLLRIALGGWRR